MIFVLKLMESRRQYRIYTRHRCGMLQCRSRVRYRRKYWNQGIVTDALQEAIYHYFTYTNTIRIFALVFEHNLPSMRVLEKAGFNKVGIMTKSIFKNGRFTNAHLFELLKNV